MELSLVLEVKGIKAYKRVNKRFQNFINIGTDNGLIDVSELKQVVCGTADDIDVSILNRRITDRKIEGHKRAPNLSLGELIELAKAKKRAKHKIAKEFITPVYAIELILAKVYWS